MDFSIRKIQKIRFTCIHMVRIPLSVKSRFKKREGEPGGEAVELTTFLSGT